MARFWLHITDAEGRITKEKHAQHVAAGKFFYRRAFPVHQPIVNPLHGVLRPRANEATYKTRLPYSADGRHIPKLENKDLEKLSIHWLGYVRGE